MAQAWISSASCTANLAGSAGTEPADPLLVVRLEALARRHAGHRELDDQLLSLAAPAKRGRRSR